MVKFCDEVNSDILQETIKQLAEEIGIYPPHLITFLSDKFIEDDYPDAIGFDPERSPESCLEYAEFKSLSKYTPERTLVTKKIILLVGNGGDFCRELNVINNFIIQGYTFSQIMNYLLDGVYLKTKYATASESSMIGNADRPHPDEIVHFLKAL